ncbi:hypothetical protein [Ferruginibacter sp.]|uniref:hypothetical protein n=1 Tax=Ferruginibacter sp. TaxID=1940288 RepID=UPI00374DCD35
MKKISFFLMLLISITAELCAQSKSDKAFEVPDNIIISRRFTVSLDKGNKVMIEVTDITDLEKVANIDSLLQIFLKDIAGLKDSLSDPLTSKRIDYLTDAEGRKKIRFQQFQPKGASFLINKGELSSLRTEQDTINIISVIANPPKAQQKISRSNPRYYHLTFYLNDVSELKNYSEMLKQKISTIQTQVNDKWPIVLGSGNHYLKGDPSIVAGQPKGFVPGGNGDFLVLNFMVNVQNYKNYFVPSFSLGAKLSLTNRERTFKWEPGLFWEPHFIFAKDALDKLHTYRNDFLTFTYGQGGITDHDPRKDFSFSALLSIGYLIHREGDYFDKQTFRLGAGKFGVRKTTIEPSLYFNNFFRGVTPGLRISQYF